MGYEILSEYLSKLMFSRFTKRDVKIAQISLNTDVSVLKRENPWLLTEKLVCKVDQKIKGRGKLGLVQVNKSIDEIVSWIDTVNYDCFIIEPLVDVIEERYISFRFTLDGDEMLYCKDGGVDVGDVESKASKILIEDISDIESLVGDLAPLEIGRASCRERV